MKRSEQNTPRAHTSVPLSLRTVSNSQYESDRLRREIERSLAPDALSEPTTAESDSPYQVERRAPPNHTDNRSVVPHESMVIPQEYDSYWNGSESMSSSRTNSERVPKSVLQPPRDDVPALPAKDSVPQAPVLQQHPMQAKSRPKLPQHRFSWEQASQSDDEAPPALMETDTVPVDHAHEPPDAANSPNPLASNEGYPATSIQPETESSPPTYDNGLNTVGPLREKRSFADPVPDGAIQGFPTATEPPALNSEQQAHEHVASLPKTNVPSNSNIDTGFPPPPPHPGVQPKIPAFREILALKTPADRIRGYNEARDQFAKQDTGLSHWLAITTSELPEHADVLSSVGRRPAVMMGHKPSSSRLLSSFRPTGQSDASESSNAMYGQGSSPSGSGNKLSSQQVQAKGKDLLRSAGVVGGKANVAAKGFFSKGRSKLRGGGGADKVDK